LIWGVMFLFQKLAIGNVIIAEVAILIPLIILLIVSNFLYHTKLSR